MFILKVAYYSFFLSSSPLIICGFVIFFPCVFKHLVLILDVSDVIPELLQDTLQDQLLLSEWQPSLPPNFGLYFYISVYVTFNS